MGLYLGVPKKKSNFFSEFLICKWQNYTSDVNDKIIALRAILLVNWRLSFHEVRES